MITLLLASLCLGLAFVLACIGERVGGTWNWVWADRLVRLGSVSLLWTLHPVLGIVWAWLIYRENLEW